MQHGAIKPGQQSAQFMADADKNISSVFNGAKGGFFLLLLFCSFFEKKEEDWMSLAFLSLDPWKILHLQCPLLVPQELNISGDVFLDCG